MKKLLIIAILLLATTVSSSRIGEVEPTSIEERPVAISDMQPVKQWDLTKAYYRQVRMPDGSLQELKSRTPLSDAQWLSFARTLRAAQLAAETEQQTVCPCCGRPYEK